MNQLDSRAAPLWLAQHAGSLPRRILSEQAAVGRLDAFCKSSYDYVEDHIRPVVGCTTVPVQELPLPGCQTLPGAGPT